LQLVKKFPVFMEPESSSPYPQVTAIPPYPEPTPSSPHSTGFSEESQDFTQETWCKKLWRENLQNSSVVYRMQPHANWNEQTSWAQLPLDSTC